MFDGDFDATKSVRAISYSIAQAKGGRADPGQQAATLAPTTPRWIGRSINNFIVGTEREDQKMEEPPPPKILRKLS